MAVFTKISKSEIEFFLKDYAIGNLVSFEGIVKGTENTNYKVVTTKDNYILTLLEKSRARRTSFLYGSPKRVSCKWFCLSTTN